MGYTMLVYFWAPAMLALGSRYARAGLVGGEHFAGGECCFGLAGGECSRIEGRRERSSLLIEGRA